MIFQLNGDEITGQEQVDLLEVLYPMTAAQQQEAKREEKKKDETVKPTRCGDAIAVARSDAVAAP